MGEHETLRAQAEAYATRMAVPLGRLALVRELGVGWYGVAILLEA
jgi:hypothetical protein